MNVRARDSASLERKLFAILLLLNTAVCAFQIATRRMPRGHDTFGNYVLSYLFMSNAAQGGGAAQWLPCMSQGMVSNWMLEVQGGILQMALLSVANLFQGVPFLPLYQLGMFADELLLLSGLWRLGRRYYASPYTLFFVGIAATGSHFWANHVYFNHRLLTGLPMILSLLHDFLDSGSRLKLSLGVNLLILQFMGNAVYVAILVAAVVGIYFVTYGWVFRGRPQAAPTALRPRRVDLLWIPANLAVLATVFVTLTHGTGEIVVSAPGRTPSGMVALDGFLTHGGNLNPLRFLDLLLGISPSLDGTLYCGILTLVCAALAVAYSPTKSVFHLALTLLAVLFFSGGYLSVAGATSYYLFPPLHLFRYVSLAAPLVKLFIILLAGHGLEVLVSRRGTHEVALKRMGLGLVVAALAVLLGITLTGGGVSLASGVLQAMASGLALRPSAMDDSRVLGLLISSALAAAASGVLLACRASHGSRFSWILPVMLVLHAGDVFRWKVQMLLQETLPLNAAQWEVQRIEPVPFVSRRTVEYDASPRYLALHPAFLQHGATYDFTDGFLHLEPPTSRFLTHMTLRGVSELQRSMPRGPAFSKIVGESKEKLQVFTSAHVSASEQELTGLLSRPEFAGDVLLFPPGPAGGSQIDPLLLTANERLEVPREVLHFGFDSLKARVSLPENLRGAWLLYSDAWHSEWTATVNGRPVGVERGFLAYKAVPLQPGANVVEFRFTSRNRALSLGLLQANSIVWCGIIVLTVAGLIRGRGPEITGSAGT